jgi:UPF0755 protein
VQVCEARDAECRAIQPGSYTVQKQSPAEVVFNILADPANVLTLQVQIREGLSVIETLRRLAEQTGKPVEEFQAAAADPAALGITPDWYTRTDGKPAATTSIEGFVFPDTYFYSPTDTAADILKMMVDRFMTVANEVGLAAKAQALGLSPYEVLIVASLAQVEAGTEADFAKVARVAYNRAVQEEIDCACLQFDSTANYFLELNGQQQLASGQMTDDVLDNPANPYNTGASSPGLPVGPISNPGQAALAGAATPADGDWLYFVAIDTNGNSAFASTYNEHCQNVYTAIENGVPLEPIC